MQVILPDGAEAEAEFDITWSRAFDNSDIGGERNEREVQSCYLSGLSAPVGTMGRDLAIFAFGKYFVEDIEDYAELNAVWTNE